MREESKGQRAKGKGQNSSLLALFSSLFSLPSALFSLPSALFPLLSPLTPHPSPLSATLVPVVACLLLASCGASPARLAHSQDSPEALARAVVSALEQRDIDTLNKLAINEAELREHVWPELPAARPERNLPFSYVWGDLHQKSTARLGQTIAKHGGKEYKLVSMRFAGGTTPYKSYRVHRDSEITVTDAEGGTQQIRLFGSVLEKDGRFKVFSYVIDD